MSTERLSVVIDTDILSEIFKRKNAPVAEKAASFLQHHERFSFSAITRYEIIRGLKAKYAIRQLGNFAAFCRHCEVLPITDEILDRAADLWTIAHERGMPKNDADLIIAATAIAHGHSLVTSNTTHFSWIPGLAVEDWRCS